VNRRVYLDTSAYLASLLNEGRAAFVRATVEKAEVVASVLLLAETWRTLVRLSREGHLPVQSYIVLVRQLELDRETFALYPVTYDLCTSTRMPTVATPRTLDLIHLRTALLFHEQSPLTTFLSLDSHQNQAAVELGLPVPATAPSQ
jgi:hypothetical protein